MQFRRFMVAAALALPLVSAHALAQGQPIVGIQTVSTYREEARIASVDKSARTVTLAFADGRQRTHQVASDTADFAAARVGEWVSLDLQDRVSFVLSGPNTRTPRDREMVAAMGATEGQRAAGVGAAQVVVTRWVTGVDPAAGTLSLVDPRGGPVRTYNVTTPEGREQLPRVKPGDSLTVVGSQIAVVSIAPRP